MQEKKFPEIELQRIILNQPNKDDIKSICEILSNEIFSQNTINIPFPYEKKDAEFWIELSKNGFNIGNQYVFAIRDKKNLQIIGGIDLGIDKRFNKAELGYWITEKHWNKGIATEAVKGIIDYGFEELKLKRIFATHFENNISSGKVLEKSGMDKEGLLKSHTFKNSEYQNHVLFAIINKKST